MEDLVVVWYGLGEEIHVCRISAFAGWTLSASCDSKSAAEGESALLCAVPGGMTLRLHLRGCVRNIHLVDVMSYRTPIQLQLFPILPWVQNASQEEPLVIVRSNVRWAQLLELFLVVCVHFSRDRYLLGGNQLCECVSHLKFGLTPWTNVTQIGDLGRLL